MVGPKKQEWQSIPGCGDVIVHVFFFFFRMLWSPIFPKKPSTSRVRQDRPNTEHPKTVSSLWSQMEPPCMAFFTKAMKWQNRKMSCFFRNPILFLHYLIYFLLERFNSELPPEFGGFLIGESDLKTPFWSLFETSSLDFPYEKLPLAQLEDGHAESPKHRNGWQNIVQLARLDSQSWFDIRLYFQNGLLKNDMNCKAWDVSHQRNRVWWLEYGQ